MTRRRKKTDGERIAETGAKTLFKPRNNAIPELARRIDRIIRKRQREAWIAGYNFREVIAELDKEGAP